MPNKPIVWRGTRSKFFTPIPSLFRDISNLGRISDKESEILRFAVREYNDELSKSSNYLNHISILQHHGFPTRCLDWSESIFTAALFAVMDPGDDGAIIGVCPTTVMFPGETVEPHVVATVPDGSKISIPEYTIRGLNSDYDTFFIQNPWASARQRAQRGMFSIHPNPKSIATIDDVKDEVVKGLDKATFPFQFPRGIIPEESKGDVMKDLWRIGVTRHSIYPEITSLSQEYKWLEANQSKSSWTSS